MKNNHKQMCRLRASKKGVSMPWETIVYFVILGVFLLLVVQSMFNPESGLLFRARDAVTEAIGMVPDTRKQIELKPIPLDPDVRKSMNSILHALIAAKDANAPCILEYKKEDLKGYIVTFLNTNGNTNMYVTTPDMQIVKPEKAKYTDYVPGVTVCVVAGKMYGTDITIKDYDGKDKTIARRDVNGFPTVVDAEAFQAFEGRFPSYSSIDGTFIAAQNFYTNWIENIPKEHELGIVDKARSIGWGGQGSFSNPYYEMRGKGQKIISPDYTNPAKILLSWRKDGVFEFLGWADLIAWANPNENSIVAYGSDNKPYIGTVSGSTIKGQDVEDGGLLYVPERGKVCFFPTFGTDDVWDCNALPEGLDEDCFDDKDNDLVYKLKKC